MVDELVLTGGEMAHVTPQLPKATPESLNGGAVLVGFKDAPDGMKCPLISILRLKKATKFDYELAADGRDYSN